MGGVDPTDCAAHEGAAHADLSTTHGVVWREKPDRIHATREVMSLYDARLVYQVVAACPQDSNRVVHCARYPSE